MSEVSADATTLEARQAAAEHDVTPPESPSDPRVWLKQNLFYSVPSAVLTIVVAALVGYLAVAAARWLIAADFDIIRNTLRIFIIGQFPNDELWRLWVSGYLVVAAAGLVPGALGRNRYETALRQGLDASKPTVFQLLRRFWALIGSLFLIAAFATTMAPIIGTVGAVVLAFVAREIGWHFPAAVRDRIVYIGAILVILSMLALAGNSKLGGFSLGLVAFVWALSEMGRLDVPTTAAGKMLQWAVPLIIGVAVWQLLPLIKFEGVGWDKWGGFHVNLFTAVVGITLGMPFGVLLALGRRSQLPVVKAVSVLFIEFVRGVPLISLLLFSGLLLPFFLPIDFSKPADLTLAIVVIMGFSAAYIAEIVRGGLQAVPNGQTEAGQALGLKSGPLQRLIVLPQALQAVIPSLVGQFISLFKDTTLLIVVGILEILNAASVANNQPEFLGKGLAPITYLFVALVFWGFNYTMSKESQLLERNLAKANR